MRWMPLSLVASLALASTMPAVAQSEKASDARPPSTQPAGSVAPKDFRGITQPGFGRSQISDAAAKQADAMMKKGFDYLLEKRGPNGGWFEDFGPAITAIVAKAFTQNPEFGPNHAVSKAALDFVLKAQRDDGAIAVPRSPRANYETAVALMFLADMREVDPKRVKPAIEKGVEFFRKIQWDEAEGVKESDPHYGGFRYGPSPTRPDLSNTQYTLEALMQVGVEKDDPMVKKALKYVERAQDHSPTNDMPWAKAAVPTDEEGNEQHVAGGFIYSAGSVEGDAKDVEGVVEANKAGAVVGGLRPRTYGSMTYAGFKSMIYAGLDKDDPRVKAAFDWIRHYYTLDANPNMPGAQSKQGLFYYYQVFAQALQAYGVKEIPTRKGDVNWREDLIETFADHQAKDGSFTNEEDRWMEDNAIYVTAISLLAMQSALN